MAFEVYKTNYMVSTNISKNYIPEWGPIEALREVIQENIDVQTLFSCTGSVQYNYGYLIVTDTGPGLKRSDLALGESGKRNGEGLIGQFGEGLKLAALVAARENREMIIDTVSFKAVPFLKYNKALGIEVLGFKLEENDREKGTVIKFQATEPEYNKVKKYFLTLDDVKRKKVKVKEYKKSVGSIILEPRGQIFVNGALATEINNLLFSYEVGDELKKAQNRDRTIIDDASIKQVIRTLLKNTSNQEVIISLFVALKKGIHIYEQDVYFSLDAKRQPYWKRALRRVYGNRVCYSTSPKIDLEAESRGYTVIDVPYMWKELIYSLIKSSQEVIGDLSYTAVKVSLLETKEKQTLKWLKGTSENIFGEVPRIKIASSIIDGDDTSQALGLWSNAKQEMILHREILSDPIKALRIYVHEMVHKITGYPDASRGFENGWNNLVLQLLLKPVKIELPERVIGLE